MSIIEQLAHIQSQIHCAEKQYHRAPGSVQLLAVSKQQSIEKIRTAIEVGQTCFGENYLQEALAKIAALQNSDLSVFQPIKWHFIGKIQSNKTQQMAKYFDWVHSVDRLHIAERLNAQRPQHLAPLNICIEINIHQENTKSGVELTALPALAHAISRLKQIRLRGLMAIPRPALDFKTQFETYQQVQKAQQMLCAQGLMLDTLSMGMSGDFIAAIAAGSTLVRVGSAIFGRR
jgi:pyridoxal phosphate enzyme (YggS family)